MKDIMQNVIGLYEKALPEDYSWEQRLAVTKYAGYEFMEISVDESDKRLSRMKWTAKEKLALAKATAKTGVPILTMCLSGNRRYPIGSENRTIRMTGVNLIKDAVKFSVDIGNRVIQLAGYDESYNEPNENTRRLFRESLGECVEFASGYNVMLAIETMENDFMDSVGKVIDHVKAINSPWLGVYPDIGNLASRGYLTEEDFLKGTGHIVAVHVKDSRPNEIRNVPFGEGIVDFVSVFNMLRRVDYSGPFVVEMWANGTNDPVEEVRKARQFITQKMMASSEFIQQGKTKDGND